MANHDDAVKFCAYYKKQLLDFLKENRLGIETEYEHVQSSLYNIVPRSFLRKDKGFYQTSFKEEDEIAHRIAIGNIIFKDYGRDFFKQLYLNASEEQKKYIHSTVIVLHALDDFSQALSEHPQSLIEYVKASKALHNEVKRSYILHKAVECWKKSLSNEQFNDLIIDYFTFYKKEFKKDKSRINVEYVLHNYVDDQATLEVLQQLLPATEQASTGDIFNERVPTFEIAIDKTKLAQYVRLENYEQYNSMYEQIANILERKEVLKELKAVRIKKEEKYKSDKNYYFLVRLDETSTITKDSFKKIVLALINEYYSVAQQNHNGSMYKTIRDDWNLNWFKKVMLDCLLEQKDDRKSKVRKV